ncbi:uncharacterized protein LOC117176651 [Belonocnema kinseyi]|uniref:uncharacterized protein LOC117176651 n=1 Tax=Belonocnema kinseyi TaxID=2817044 RepID=UPI00143D94E8|nr:uncharacterized protein LOC117176651 [Belonocnema kinseyi]
MFDIGPIQKESASSLRALVDNLSKHLRALKNLEEPVDQWDTLILHLISSKLDSSTNREWESKVISNGLTTIEELTEFILDRCQLLETVQANKPLGNSSKQNKCLSQINKRSDRSGSYLATEAKTDKCIFCNEEHNIYECQPFLNLSVPSRWNEIKKHNRCLNSLGIGHLYKFCRSRRCEECNEKQFIVTSKRSERKSGRRKTRINI